MTASNKPALILLVGPTAVGKTEIAIQLAQRINGEILSADSRLFYRGMDIGTAKPAWEERQQVPHHLIDIADPDHILSLSDFQEKAREIIAALHRVARLPLLVGGTGQYMRAVTEGWMPPEVKADPRMRNELERMKAERGGAWLHQKLATLDPKSARSIDARNVRRTIRALEVILTTGRRFSEQRLQQASPYQLISIGLLRPRPELYARIDARIDAMFEAGLLDEVRGLLAKGYSPDLPTLSAIGYRECIRVIDGQWTVEQAKVEMRRATRVYVRRQGNWFKENDPNIRWFEAGKADVVDEIEAFIRTILHE
jgi:tRNA dimethylallyltransferase